MRTWILLAAAMTAVAGTAFSATLQPDIQNQEVVLSPGQSFGYAVWVLANPSDSPIQIRQIKAECPCTDYYITATTVPAHGTVGLLAFYDNRRIPPGGRVGVMVKSLNNLRTEVLFLSLHAVFRDDSHPASRVVAAADLGDDRSFGIADPPRGSSVTDLTPLTEPRTATEVAYRIRLDEPGNAAGEISSFPHLLLYAHLLPAAGPGVSVIRLRVTYPGGLLRYYEFSVFNRPQVP